MNSKPWKRGRNSAGASGNCPWFGRGRQPPLGLNTPTDTDEETTVEVIVTMFAVTIQRMA